MTKCVATAVMRIRGSSGSGAWPLPHAFEFEKLLALIVRGLDGTILPKDRSGELIHGVRYCGCRSLAENGRRGDLRPLAGSGRRAVRGSRLLGCSTFLHRSTCNPGKPRSADAPHSQPKWSALGAGRGASRFALSRRANPRRAPELRTDRVQALFFLARQSQTDASPVRLRSLSDQVPTCLKCLDRLRSGATGGRLKLRKCRRVPGKP